MSHTISVLLIDDDEDDCQLTRIALESIEASNYRLDCVSDYDGGLTAMTRGEHDVYLVDYHLGPDSGVELTRQAIALGCAKPIIILTGQGDHEVDLAAMSAGASAYLVKGCIGAEALERTIRYAMERSNILAELRQNESALRRQASTDILTGVSNRRHLEERLQEEVALAHRHGYPFSLCMCDIDHFKLINDTHGHLAGDFILKTFGELLTAEIRLEDVPGRPRAQGEASRYGGDEFCIMFPHTPAAQAFGAISRLRAAIAGFPFIYA